MKNFIVFCSFIISANCASIFDKKLDNEWSVFKRIYKKRYVSIYEEYARRTVWETNLDKIHQHNHETDMGVHSYTLGMNKFGDLTHEEFKKQMTDFSISSNINKKVSANDDGFVARPGITVPRAVDWRREGFVTPVKDQGSCGASWAFSAAGALEGQHVAQTRELVPLSAQNLIDCSNDYGNDGCNGGTMDAAFQYIRDHGIDTEQSYPYEARTGVCRFNVTNIGANSTGYRDVQSGSEPALTYYLAIVGPVSVAIDASLSTFQFYKSGVYDDPQCSSTAVNHAALAVGFNATDSQLYYIVKNSWGTSWGLDGYIWMSRNKNNQCGIATIASYPRFA